MVDAGDRRVLRTLADSGGSARACSFSCEQSANRAIGIQDSWPWKRSAEASSLWQHVTRPAFYAVDFRDAYVEKAAVEKSSQQIAAIGPTATTWYVARWGFQYYAERAGMKPVLPDQSDFQPGDWLVISDSIYFPKPVSAHINRYQIDPVTQVVLEDRLPLQTMLGYYNSGLPIQHHEGPRRRVRIYRIAGLAIVDSPR